MARTRREHLRAKANPPRPSKHNRCQVKGKTEFSPGEILHQAAASRRFKSGNSTAPPHERHRIAGGYVTLMPQGSTMVKAHLHAIDSGLPVDLPLLQNCEGCGACCHTVSAPPFRIDHEVDEPRAKGVPQALIDEFLPAWRVRLVSTAAPCVWYDETTRRCRHYDLRPDACRDFELNSPSCIAVRRQFPAR